MTTLPYAVDQAPYFCALVVCSPRRKAERKGLIRLNHHRRAMRHQSVVRQGSCQSIADQHADIGRAANVIQKVALCAVKLREPADASSGAAAYVKVRRRIATNLA